jgi:hypothetical protein
VKPIALFAIVSMLTTAPVSADPLPQSYDITQGGITHLVSTRIRSKIVLSPNPSGIKQGQLQLRVDKTTGHISVTEGTLHLSDFEIKIGSGFFSTRLKSSETKMDFLRGAEGKLNQSGAATLTSAVDSKKEKNTIVVKSTTKLDQCSGPLCIMLSTIDLNLVSYTLDLQLSDDHSKATGKLSGLTTNGSQLELLLSAAMTETLADNLADN